MRRGAGVAGARGSSVAACFAAGCRACRSSRWQRPPRKVVSPAADHAATRTVITRGEGVYRARSQRGLGRRLGPALRYPTTPLRGPQARSCGLDASGAGYMQLAGPILRSIDFGCPTRVIIVNRCIINVPRSCARTRRARATKYPRADVEASIGSIGRHTSASEVVACI